MSETGPDTPNADRVRAEKAASEGQAAGGVRRLTDADANGRRGRALRRAVGDESELPQSRPLIRNLGIVVGTFAGVTLIAEAAGAANLGTALSFGQIGFAIALVFVLVKR